MGLDPCFIEGWHRGLEDGRWRDESKMKWITREGPKIDPIACPWLVTRFVDESPEFL